MQWFMYNLLWVFVSRYRNKVDFILTDEAQMGGNGTVPDWGHAPPPLALFGAVTAKRQTKATNATKRLVTDSYQMDHWIKQNVSLIKCTKALTFGHI